MGYIAIYRNMNSHDIRYKLFYIVAALNYTCVIHISLKNTMHVHMCIIMYTQMFRYYIHTICDCM